MTELRVAHRATAQIKLPARLTSQGHLRSFAKNNRISFYSVLSMLRAIACWMLLSVVPATAHQPVVNSESSTVNTPFEVNEPEVSKAIFAQLKGAAQYYRIASDVPFRFYAGITVPKIDGCPLDHRFSLDVLDKDLRLIVAADGERFDWWPWYESFGGKWYWVGPEIGSHFKGNRQLEAGTYYLRVFNAEQAGRYVLAIGDIESFPIDVIARTLIQMPGINHDFWDTATCKGK